MGVNHFTWFTEAKYKEYDLFPIYKEYCEDKNRVPVEADKNWMNHFFYSKEKVKMDLFLRYGAIAAAGDRHLAEFCPGKWYLGEPEYVYNKWGYGLTPVSWRKKELEERVARRDRLLLHTFFCLRYYLLTFFNLQLNAVLSAFPLAVQNHAYFVGLRQLIADSDKPDHIISVAVGASCLLRHALIGCLYADNAILITGIVKNRPIISPDIAHNKSLLSGFPDIVLSAFLPSFPKSSRFVQRPFYIEPATLRYRYIILIDIGVLCL